MAYLVQVRMAKAMDGRILWGTPRRMAFKNYEDAVEYETRLIRDFLGGRLDLSRIIETRDRRKVPEKWEIIR